MSGIEKQLKEKGIYITKIQGDSMYPMLRAGESRVVIIPPVFPLKKYDVPVYRKDGHYTMHRIVKVKNGRYVICADNRISLEKNIEEKDIVGVLSGFYNRDEFISCDDPEYLRYAKRICRSYPKRVIQHYFKAVRKKAGLKKYKSEIEGKEQNVQKN